jgi:hypothetical protein
MSLIPPNTAVIDVSFMVKNRTIFKSIAMRYSYEYEFNDTNETKLFPEDISFCADRCVKDFLQAFNSHSSMRHKILRVAIPREGIFVGHIPYVNEETLWSFSVKHKKGEITGLRINFDYIYDLNKWCKKNCKGCWYIKPGWIYFSNDVDRALYLLTKN